MEINPSSKYESIQKNEESSSSSSEKSGDDEANYQEDQEDFGKGDSRDAVVLFRPPDKYKIVYLIFVLHGVGTLMPWNMFINAKEYFEKFKLLSSDNSNTGDGWYSANFFTFLFWAAQIPNLVFSWVNIVFPCRGSVKIRILVSLSVAVLICIITVIFAAIDTSDAVGLIFWLTMLSVFVINVAGGFYQNSVYGIGANLGLSGAVVLGSNLSGVFTSVTNLVVLATETSQQNSALFYFGAATLIMLSCLVSYLFLPMLKFYRYHHQDSNDKSEDDNSINGRDYWNIFKQCRIQCFNVFFVFFVSLMIFPNVHANVKVLSADFIINDDNYFSGVTCFLTFNLTALLGNLLAAWIQWPKPKYLWIAVTLRLLFIPFFLFCNYHPHGFLRNGNTVLIGDWAYWIAGMLLGLTSGYFSSLGMMYCPRAVVDSKHAPVAGMFGAAFLVTGVFFGVNFSNIMPYLVARKDV